MILICETSGRAFACDLEAAASGSVVDDLKIFPGKLVSKQVFLAENRAGHARLFACPAAALTHAGDPRKIATFFSSAVK